MGGRLNLDGGRVPPYNLSTVYKGVKILNNIPSAIKSLPENDLICNTKKF